MFSGIVEEVGCIVQADHDSNRLALIVKICTAHEDIKIGDSVAVNGVCLTVCKIVDNYFTFEVMPETLRCTTLGQLATGSSGNIERSMHANGRIGGHLVQGHVDGTVSIVSIEQDGCALKMWFNKYATYSDCFIPKGYVAIDGMSLTIVDVTSDLFSICFIPHTQAVTVVKSYQVGMSVNVEVDHVVKTITIMLNQKGLSHGKHI